MALAGSSRSNLLPLRLVEKVYGGQSLIVICSLHSLFSDSFFSDETSRTASNDSLFVRENNKFLAHIRLHDSFSAGFWPWPH